MNVCHTQKQIIQYEVKRLLLFVAVKFREAKAKFVRLPGKTIGLKNVAFCSLKKEGPLIFIFCIFSLSRICGIIPSVSENRLK